MHLSEELEKAVAKDIEKALDDSAGKPVKCDDLYRSLGHVSLDDFRSLFRRVSDARVLKKSGSGAILEGKVTGTATGKVTASVEGIEKK